MDWNGKDVRHMSTSHLINTCAWIWRILMHKRAGLIAPKYAEGPNKSIDSTRVEYYSESFMDNFDQDLAAEQITTMLREIHRRKR